MLEVGLLAIKLREDETGINLNHDDRDHMIVS